MFPNRMNYTDFTFIIKLFHREKIRFFSFFTLQREIIKKMAVFCDQLWQTRNFIINCSLISMLLPTFYAGKEDSDFTIFHFITRWIHCSLTFTCSISRNWTIYMFWSKTKRTMITAGFLCFGNFFSTIETRKRFINSFHKNNQQIEIKFSFIPRTSFPLG